MSPAAQNSATGQQGKCVAALTRRTAEEEIGPQDQRAGKIHGLGGLSLSLEAVASPSSPAWASFRRNAHKVHHININTIEAHDTYHTVPAKIKNYTKHTGMRVQY